jgi:uncharacterized Zn finger protein
MVCPKCSKEVTPQVVAHDGFPSRICPECGSNVDPLLKQDAKFVRVPSIVGLSLLAIVALVFLFFAFRLL